MKNRISYFVIVFLCIVNINAQNSVLITYSVNYSFENVKLPDEKQNVQISNEIKDVFLKFGNYVTYSLIAKNKQSIFFKNNILFDENVNEFQKKIISAYENDTYFLDYEKKEFYKKKFFENKNFIFSLNLNENKWEILNERKKIDNFNCIKAKITRYVKDVEVIFYAWFTPELPFQIGPQNFMGLPGVILEVSNGKYSIVAKSINLNPSEDELSKVVMPIGTLITIEDFNKIVQKARDNFEY